MRDPGDLAKQYRVQALGEGQFSLYALGSSTNLDLRKQGAFLSFVTTPRSAHWHASRDSAFQVVRLTVEKLGIGHSGDSYLVDDCLFVIDGEELRHVPLTEIRVVDDKQFDLEIADIARMRGVHANPEADRTGDRPLARLRIVHCEAVPGVDSTESLEGTIGLSQEYFQSLFASCLARQISRIHFRGIGSALSSSFGGGEPRELILCAGDRFNVDVNTVAFDYFV